MYNFIHYSFSIFWFESPIQIILFKMFILNIFQFLEGMYLKYNDKAAEKGVYVIGSCGFDSIPADLGILYTRDSLKGNFF